MGDEEHRGLVLCQALHETEVKVTVPRAGLHLSPCTAAGTHLLDVPQSEVLARGLQQLMDIGSWERFGRRETEVWACLPLGRHPLRGGNQSCMNQIRSHLPGSGLPRICPVEKP